MKRVLSVAGGVLFGAACFFVYKKVRENKEKESFTCGYGDNCDDCECESDCDNCPCTGDCNNCEGINRKDDSSLGSIMKGSFSVSDNLCDGEDK